MRLESRVGRECTYRASVGVDEGKRSGVVGEVGDGLDELEHGRDTGACGYHAHVLDRLLLELASGSVAEEELGVA